MRSFRKLSALAVVCTLASTNFALAGNHSHSGGNSCNHSSKSFKNPKSKPITGTKGEVGFIADPFTRNLKPKKQSSNVTKIVDPIRPMHGTHTVTGGGQFTTTTETSLIAITPNPTRVAPVIRDHTVMKPTTPKNPYANPPTVTGGTGLKIVNPFSFTAPIQPGQGRDHRTQVRGGGHNTPSGEFTPNTNGPANKVPTRTTQAYPGGKKGH